MGLIYVGIDEAGYGPMLGPLCVGLAAFRIDRWSPGDRRPDLWKSLRRAVCTAPRDPRNRIPIADSKKLKGPNQLKTRHPLAHLERGVLAGAHAAGLAHETDADLLVALGAALDPMPWYEGEPVPLPLGGEPGPLAIDAGLLAAAMESAGVEALALRCVAVCEAEFNRSIERAGSKAAVLTRAVAGLIRRSLATWADRGDEVRIVCDRQGGRVDYADLLAAAAGSRRVAARERRGAAARYEIETTGEPAAVLFMPEAEDAHMPVALASMTAKYARELSMARFNRYWCARMQELRPTAGYVTDARRWLHDAEPVLTPEVRRAIVRLA